VNAEKLRKLAIQVMIGGLIGAAVIAVIAVLAGSFSDVFEKALFTLLLVMFHALVSLAFIDRNLRKTTTGFRFFENSVFFIIVLSFFTSIFGVWGLIDGSLVAKLYASYGILLFACLHGQMLDEVKGKQSNIDNIANANYSLMFAVIILILPIIWLINDHFPSLYYRLLAAAGIIDATLTILAVILHRMYVQKHPEAKSTIFNVVAQYDTNGKPFPVSAEVKQRHLHPLVWVLIILLGAQVVVSLLFAGLGAFYRQ
jgi:hypothetical protein